MSDIICKFCFKKYKSYASRSNHYRKYHQKNINENDDSLKKTINDLEVPEVKLEVKSSLCCKHCNKKFNFIQARWAHEKICTTRTQLIITRDEYDKIKKAISENDELKKQMDELRKQVEKIMNDKSTIIKKSKTINNNCNNTTNTNNIQNNNIQNNINIVQLGSENLSEILTKDEKLTILGEKWMSLEYMLKYIHFNDKFPQFKNIAITNQKNNLAQIYDAKEQKFILMNKDELIDKVIEERSCDIYFFYEELANQIDDNTRDVAEKLVDIVNKDRNKTENKEFVTKKKENVKLIIFNNSDKK